MIHDLVVITSRGKALTNRSGLILFQKVGIRIISDSGLRVVIDTATNRHLYSKSCSYSPDYQVDRHLEMVRQHEIAKAYQHQIDKSIARHARKQKASP